MHPIRQPIEAVFERGRLKPLKRLPLAEHQRVGITIVSDELSGEQLARLAAASPSLQFLADPAEDVYSPSDGQSV